MPAKANNKVARRVVVLHGPNLNLLGTREPAIYGSETLADINRRLVSRGRSAGAEVRCYQHNAEAQLIEAVHEAGARAVDFIIINPAGYTHTSVALRDALVGVGRPFVEVHLSNVHAREPFRHHSFLSDRAVGVVAGFGVESYLLGLRGLVAHLHRAAKT